MSERKKNGQSVSHSDIGLLQKMALRPIEVYICYPTLLHSVGGTRVESGAMSQKDREQGEVSGHITGPMSRYVRVFQGNL